MTLSQPNHLDSVDDDLETAVLGAVIAWPDLVPTLLTILPKPTAFYTATNRCLYNAIRVMYESGEVIDMLTVVTYLRQNKLSDKVPAHYVAEVMAKGVSTGFESKCRILFQLAVGRFLHQYGVKLSRLALDSGVDTLKLLSQVQTDLNGIVNQIQPEEPRPSDYIAQVVQEIEAKLEGRITPGITTGIPILDARSGGFEPGNFVILAARPAVGKSAVLLHWLLHHTLEMNKPAGLFTLEMSGKEVLRRAMAHRTGFSNFELQRGKGVDLEVIHKAYEPLATMPLHLYDKPVQLPELINRAREWHRRYGISLLGVDYIQLVKIDSRYSKGYDRVTEVSNSLKALAQETGMVIIGLSQLSRECEKRSGWDKRPQLFDLRESGSLEQDANAVLMLFRPHQHELNYADGSVTESTLEIHALKLRNGKPTKAGEGGDPLIVDYDAPTNRVMQGSTVVTIKPGEEGF